MTERDSVPTWAQPQPAGWTEPQRKFIVSLLEERDISGLSDEQQAFLEGDFVLNKAQASRVIETLLKQPKKPKDLTPQPGKTRPEFWADVPAGRYAVDSNEGELRFYQVWRPKDNQAVFRLYVLHGPDNSQVHRNAINTIMAKIAVNPREAAIRYGLEIGSCSNCGRRLTNRISRELGIGPVCGGRMFGDEFKPMIGEKRAELLLRGLDPEEEIGD